MLKPLICPCCGGRITRKTMKCGYCGTEYEIQQENEPLRIRVETFQNPVVNLAVKTMIDCDLFHKLTQSGVAKDYIGRKIAEEIAYNIVKDELYIKDIEYNPKLMAYEIRTMIKVVKPDENFRRISNEL